MVKKKKKGTFQEFRSNEKSAYTTIKTTLKSVLHNHKEVQPVITNLVFEMNDLMIHSYQFIRLYVLKYYKNNINNQLSRYYRLKKGCDWMKKNRFRAFATRAKK